RTDYGQWWVAVSSGSAFTNELWGAWSTGVTWSDVRVGDFNDDGNSDLIGRTNGGEWWAAVSSGSAFANDYVGAWSVAVTWEDVCVGDLDGDGDDDILGCIQGSDAWWAGVLAEPAPGDLAMTNEAWA
ncbi:MAG: hypothetical protein V2A58_00470, partial [Planctomycetota bacterium]